MKKFLKSPLKVIMAGMLMAAIGFGLSTSLKVSESNGNIDLLALGSTVAGGEASGVWNEVIYTTYPRSITCKGNGTLECKWP